jgi:hypothetical protein
MARLLIGFVGPKGAGKSTCCDLISEIADEMRESALVPVRPVTKIAFAAPLKRMAIEFGLREINVYGSSADKEAPLDILAGKSARYFMQRLGTEFGRDCLDERVWERVWAQSVDTCPSPVITCDDVRFSNESTAIRFKGGTIIRVMRAKGDLKAEPEHPSEAFAHLHADQTIINPYTSTRIELKRKLKRLLSKQIKAALVEKPVLEDA